MAGNYVSCGVETLVQIFATYFKEKGYEYLTEEQMMDFFTKTSDKFLTSFGTMLNYKSKKIPVKQNEFFKKLLIDIKSKTFFKGIKLYLDSGGFQIANGALRPETIPEFMDLYYKFIVENEQYIDHAFTMDVPPGPKSEDIFNSYEEIQQLNEMSYKKCLEIVPERIRKEKMIYVHHFRTPKLLEIWNDLLRNKKLGDGYNYYAVGGLIANMATSHGIPISIISLPLVNLVDYLKSNKITKFKFHVLGGAQFQELLTYQLYSKILKIIHDVDIEITYDSSMIFKGLTRGRIIYLFKEGDILSQVSLKSKELHMKFDNQTMDDKLYNVFNEMGQISGFKSVNKNLNPIYDLKSNTFDVTIQVYLFLYCLYIYKKVEEICEIEAEKLIQFYMAGHTKQFNEEASLVLRKLSNNKMTDKQKIKIPAMWKTLDLLKELNVEKANHYIYKYMSSDDISFGKGILKF